MKHSLICLSIVSALSSAAAAASEPDYQGAAAELTINNTCIVRFDDKTEKLDVEGKARGLLARANAQAKHIYKHAMKGMAVNMSCDQARTMFAAESAIMRFTPDGAVYASPAKKLGKPGGGTQNQTIPWSVSRVGGPVDGNGYTAWVIDTGIDVDHADLNVDSSRGFSAFSKGKNAGVDDANGHGTHVAGTIAALDNSQDVVGVAAGATVIPVKVLDSRGSGSWSGVLAGIDHVAANASPGDCVNMSLGGGFNQELNDAVESAAQQSGAFFVIAAGNESQHASNVSPASASHPRVYTISATDANDRFASFSNYGNPPVDYAAPGVSILSTRSGGGTTTMSGTSMASPAACAVIMMNNGNPRTDGRASGDPDGNADSIIHL
ncbi:MULTISPECIES: S8 family serine peptidase [Pseudoalteromonas]|uniref:S8 family serine peptidase n=1 Tax=Pseudoalteromonas rubra TaxID=43658 RepID=A0A5S3USH3_9GAMM|nr:MULTISPECIES: S8 family serine peptidase [Pseudoalteromonas]MCG7560623.1 S8 family serine peptidase [Pseudoalteromonas sp. McH1-42]MEC4087620.1 S8 family serine peptidase [Pseudoalteromonas rubra]QPB84094.1 S8 family serine peptidase [Pseudoalteromonas rubra]